MEKKKNKQPAARVLSPNANALLGFIETKTTQPSKKWDGKLYVKNLEDGTIHLVKKYIYTHDNDEIHVWADSWYGHHIVGKDCELINPIKS